MSSTRSHHNPTLTRYFSEIRHYPPLTREQEGMLSRNVQGGCKTSRDELVEANLSFVVKVASEYRNLGLPFEDLLNEGNLGLIEAAHRFDATKGTKFITYAIWWIRKSILKALGDRSALVRVRAASCRTSTARAGYRSSGTPASASESTTSSAARSASCTWG